MHREHCAFSVRMPNVDAPVLFYSDPGGVKRDRMRAGLGILTFLFRICLGFDLKHIITSINLTPRFMQRLGLEKT